MPHPSTTALPRPKSWDELEDICADVLKRVWLDPYVVRNGRSGQSQHGVDLYGYPQHLGDPSAGKLAGAQCKNTEALAFSTVAADIELASHFTPPLAEYLVLTSAPRDATLQEALRKDIWPFRVHIMFWEDLSLELSAHDDLLRKHFPGWLSIATSKDDVLRKLSASQPSDFDYWVHLILRGMPPISDTLFMTVCGIFSYDR